jgi:UDP-N-acetylmuramate--alanine ligase
VGNNDIWNGNGRNHSVYFIGIGGIGMSALARWFLAENWAVAGSDLEGSHLTAELAAEGALVKIGTFKRIPGRPALVVHSNAIPPSNLELLDARSRGLKVFSYPQMVGEVSRRYETIAIAGAHGKSTTTGIMSLILSRLGLDPTVLIGTKLRELSGKNFRSGQSRYLVLEADEYARAFLNYSPAYLIVTNIDREHLDIYKNLIDIKRTFLQLFSRVLPGGALVLNADDPNLTIMQTDIEKIAERKRLRVFWYSRRTGRAKKVKAALHIPGQHNVADATAAFTLATKVLHLPEDGVLRAIAKYRGSWRRYEYKGEYRVGGIGYEVFDDYAHHPTEIQATLAAFKEKFPFTTIICVFQPHQAERLKRLFRDFSRSFKDADALILLPAYHVAGREAAESQYTSQALAAAVSKKNPRTAVLYQQDPHLLSRGLIRESFLKAGKDNDQAVVVMMGAGTISNYTPLLLK